MMSSTFVKFEFMLNLVLEQITSKGYFPFFIRQE